MRKPLEFKLYAITGEDYHPGRSMLDVMEAALAGGADIVQLRDKKSPKAAVLEKAKALRELTSRYGVPFIVNDYPGIAHAVEADGVHLGQEDLSITEARALLGPDAIVGISTHSIEQARAAQASGADYIGVGPVFPTGTKPGRQAVTTAYVRQAAAEIRIPWVAIGGITLDNADEVLAAGATRLCAVAALVGSEDPRAAAWAFRERIAAASLLSATTMAAQALKQGGGVGLAVPTITVRINGRTESVAARNVAELVAAYGLGGRRIVAELDGEIVSRSAWEDTPLREGAVVELVHFVGGG